jgi:hypothetical protein
MAIDLEQVRKGFVFQSSAPIGAVLEDLQTIAQADQQFARVRKARFWRGMMCVGGLVLGIVLAASEILTTLAVFLIVLAPIAAIVFFVKAATYGGKLKKYHWRYETLRDLCGTLLRDTHPNAPVNVSLALQDTSRLVSEAPWPVRKKGKQSFSDDSWLFAGGQFLDGAQYSLALRELIRKRTYVNPRGKYKTKYRSWYFLTVRVVCPKDLYGDLRPLENGLRKTARLPQSCVLRGVKAAGKAVAMKVRVDRMEDVRGTAVMMFLALYRGLNLARRLHGSHTSGKGAA